MRVLICGGRAYKDYKRFCTEMLNIEPSLIINGGARGADAMASAYACQFDIPELVFHADWDRHGKAAGPIRNQRMLDEGKPELLMAFPGGRGTADMMRRAKRAGIKVIEIR